MQGKITTFIEYVRKHSLVHGIDILDEHIFYTQALFRLADNNSITSTYVLKSDFKCVRSGQIRFQVQFYITFVNVIVDDITRNCVNIHFSPYMLVTYQKLFPGPSLYFVSRDNTQQPFMSTVYL